MKTTLQYNGKKYPIESAIINEAHPKGCAIQWKHSIPLFQHDFLYSFDGVFYGVDSDWSGSSQYTRLNVAVIVD